MIVKIYGIEIIFNGIYFHRHFYLKTGVSRNGLSLGYSERDTSTAMSMFCSSQDKNSALLFDEPKATSREVILILMRH